MIIIMFNNNIFALKMNYHVFTVYETKTAKSILLGLG